MLTEKKKEKEKNHKEIYKIKKCIKNSPKKRSYFYFYTRYHSVLFFKQQEPFLIYNFTNST